MTRQGVEKGRKSGVSHSLLFCFKQIFASPGQHQPMSIRWASNPPPPPLTVLFYSNASSFCPSNSALNWNPTKCPFLNYSEGVISVDSWPMMSTTNFLRHRGWSTNKKYEMHLQLSRTSSRWPFSVFRDGRSVRWSHSQKSSKMK